MYFPCMSDDPSSDTQSLSKKLNAITPWRWVVEKDSPRELLEQLEHSAKRQTQKGSPPETKCTLSNHIPEENDTSLSGQPSVANSFLVREGASGTPPQPCWSFSWLTLIQVLCMQPQALGKEENSGPVMSREYHLSSDVPYFWLSPSLCILFLDGP